MMREVILIGLLAALEIATPALGFLVGVLIGKGIVWAVDRLQHGGDDDASR